MITKIKPLTCRVVTKSNPIPVWTGWRLYAKYRDATMIPETTYIGNIVLSRHKTPPSGCIVECGVWRGGMSAGIADALPGRLHYLFDSFQGLPMAEQIDGPAALAWQADTSSPFYYDNCRAERNSAESAMKRSAARSFQIVQGWFKDTLPHFVPDEPIALLRLDGDWYESTIECLSHLYRHVMIGGLIIFDDYYAWDGCARALHDFLSQQRLCDRIESALPRICYLIKRHTVSIVGRPVASEEAGQ
jgi:O-methyltransferase